MKLSGIFAAFAALILCSPIAAFSAETEIVSELEGITLTCVPDSSGEFVTIVSADLDNDTRNVVIPEKIGKYTVSAIGEKVFAGKVYAEKITLPETVAKIGKAAFMGCSSLTEVTVNGDVTEIPEDCFFACSHLVTVVLPDTLLSIGDEAFFGCPQLDVTIPESVGSVGTNAVGISADPHSGENIPIYGFLIKGTAGSAAEEYAAANGIDFIDLNSYTAGDVNGDNYIDSSDASDVLLEYSRASTGTPLLFTKKQRIIGDMNKDGFVDSSDASDILIIYSILSTT